MKHVDRYLRTVKFYLPTGQRDDIIAELSEDIRSQIADLEAANGGPLGDDEVAELLRKRGSPILVAGRFLPQQHLIGPAFYPLYRFVLKLVVLWIQVPLFLAVIGPINVLTSPNPVGAVIATLGGLLQAILISFGVITCIFAMLEHRDIFQSQPANRTARRSSITDLINATSRVPLWVWLVQLLPGLNLNGVHILLTPIWQVLFWPILVILTCSAAVQVFSMASPAHARSQRIARLVIDGLGLLGIAVLLTARSWVQISAPALSAATAVAASKWANINAAILLMGALIAIVVDLFQEMRPAGAQAAGTFQFGYRAR